MELQANYDFNVQEIDCGNPHAPVDEEIIYLEDDMVCNEDEHVEEEQENSNSENYY